MRLSRLLPNIALFSAQPLFGQVVNGYANVSSIAGSVINVNSVNETSDTFEDGEWIVIMQMQDDVINTTTNVATFGDMTGISSTGLYEIKQIVSHTEAAGLPTSFTVSGSLTNTYQFGANTHIQVISYRQLGSPNYTTTGNIAALDWNGTVGGVVAIYVPGILTLGHSITANAAGFRAGARSADYYSGGTGCSTTEYIRTTNHTRAGAKGEGIYRTATTDYLYSRGRLLNGGGGGSERINCGGGGGGNFTQGGQGGDGWSCAGPGGGGLGGLSLSAYISSTRVFMGGGGGGGQQNNTASTDGGDGGGIILIHADEIRSTGTCGIAISANGQSPVAGNNDGQGGGGAGGSIVIQVNTWNIAASCPITVASNGGNGGNVNSSVHGGGGGGGQGVVIYSIAEPSANTTTQTNNGNAGCNNSACTSLAGAPTGANGDGVIDNLTGPLPVELLDFQTHLNADGTVLNLWQTASEINNMYFIVQRSFNGRQWVDIDTVQGAGNSVVTQYYSNTDKSPITGNSYYRLKQVDFDGTYKLSNVNALHIPSDNQVWLYPNPANDVLHVVTNDSETGDIEIVDMSGRVVLRTQVATGVSVTDIRALPAGTYIVRLHSAGSIRQSSLVIYQRN
jgi:hypothetical protein